jgi:hypothetical protein
MKHDSSLMTDFTFFRWRWYEMKQDTRGVFGLDLKEQLESHCEFAYAAYIKTVIAAIQ